MRYDGFIDILCTDIYINYTSVTERYENMASICFIPGKLTIVPCE